MNVATRSSPASGMPAAIFGVALGLAASQLCVADDVLPVHAYFSFVHWVSVGRADLAAEQFCEDAIVIAGPGCTPAVPCIGRDAIRRRYIKPLLARRTQLPLLDQRFDGQSLRTRGETIVQSDPRGGVVRLLGGHVFEFRGGLIRSLRVELDLRDSATAAFVERQRAELSADR